jgi:hypothetical protein
VGSPVTSCAKENRGGGGSVLAKNGGVGGGGHGFYRCRVGRARGGGPSPGTSDELQHSRRQRHSGTRGEVTRAVAMERN